MSGCYLARESFYDHQKCCEFTRKKLSLQANYFEICTVGGGWLEKFRQPKYIIMRYSIYCKYIIMIYSFYCKYVIMIYSINCKYIIMRYSIYCVYIIMRHSIYSKYIIKRYSIYCKYIIMRYRFTVNTL